VALLLLKLFLTPVIVGGASLASRRWGPAIGGWIVSLPLTSGPVLFYLALDPGPVFAREAATGTLLGLGAIAGFALGYLVGSRWSPRTALALAATGFVTTGLAIQPVSGAPFPLLVAGVGMAIAAVLSLLPPAPAAEGERSHPAWDLPVRITVGTVFVVTLTTVAPLVGPIASGLVATFPVYAAVLAVFEHRRTGRLAALGTLRGLLTGLPGTVAFYVVLTALLPAGVAMAFAVALAATLVMGAASLRVVRARSGLVERGTAVEPKVA
jgi:hypothetical protein